MPSSLPFSAGRTTPIARAAPVRGRDHRQRRGPRPAQVLVGQVEDALVVGVGVDGRHEALLDAERVLQHLGHRRQAVGGAGRVRDDVVLLGVVLVVVDAEQIVTSGSLAGAEMITLLAPGVEVQGGLVAVGEERRCSR